LTPASPAPIALFAFRRPDHVRRALASLSACSGFEPGRLHVFCDGPRTASDEAAVAATRSAIHSFGLRGARIVEHDENRGLARSTIGGVGELCDACGHVIVLEDDLVLASGFLEFMDRALARYADEERVYQVNGYVFPTRFDIGTDAFFLPFVGSWGWATWERAWKDFDPDLGEYEQVMSDRRARRHFDLGGAYPYARLLRRQRAGRIDSWAIRWYLSVYVHGGLALYPRRSLVQNIGLDGSGTHWRARDSAMTGELYEGSLVKLPDKPEVDPTGLREAVAFLRRYSNPFRKALRRLRQRLRSS
jgi:hypothetical protein